MPNYTTTIDKPRRHTHIAAALVALIVTLAAPRPAHADAETAAAVLVGAALLYAAHDDYKERDKKHRHHGQGRDDYPARYHYNGQHHRHDDYQRNYHSGGKHFGDRGRRCDHRRSDYWHRDRGYHADKGKHWRANPHHRSHPKYEHSAKWNTRVRAY